MEKLELFGDIPEPRFGHTVTQISPTKVILYGGAIGYNGKYSITSKTYLLDLITKKWRKLDPQGSCPNERAAHATASVECLQLVLYGGATGGGGLANEHLFLLDLRMGEDRANWVLISTIGYSPGRRYGHSLIFAKPFLVVFGGIPGTDPTNDTYTLNIEKSPFTWVKFENNKEIPPVRVYHSASLCISGSAKGMMVIFGGRTLDQSALNDTWGFRKHKDGRWDWIKAAYKTEGELPTPRFQHQNIFLHSLFFVIGGRTNVINENLQTEIYDIELNTWFKISGISRFRQTNWIHENFLYIHGGLEQASPNCPINDVLKVDLMLIFQNTEHLLKILCSTPETHISRLETNLIKYGPGSDIYATAINPSKKSPLSKSNISNKNLFQLSKKAYIAQSYQPFSPETQKIRKISIIKLQEESKKIGNMMSLSSIKTFNWKNNDDIADFFLEQLLITKSFTYDLRFQFDKEYLEKLCEEAEKLFQKEPSLIQIKSPVKIFGNLYGQLGDLLKLFENFGTPSDSVFDGGDIDGFSYLFLGDYIDRGNYSLETLALLFAFKVKHPDSFILLRGHHEDIFINRNYGFGEECSVKLEENIEDPTSFFQRINKIFEYLPLAAVVDNEIFCVHGGIGNTLKKIEEIERLERPIEVSHNPKNQFEKIVFDILMSNPAIDQKESKPQQNSSQDDINNSYFSKFTMERVQQFLKENKLKSVIRSHECALHGFQSFGFDSLITVFSTTNYFEKNEACIIAINKNMKIVKKVISSEDEKKEGKWKKFEGKKN